MSKNKANDSDKEKLIANSITASVLNYGILSNGIVTKGDYPVPSLNDENGDIKLP